MVGKKRYFSEKFDNVKLETLTVLTETLPGHTSSYLMTPSIWVSLSAMAGWSGPNL